MKAQNIGFDTYLLIPQQRGSQSQCLRAMDKHIDDGYMRGEYKCPCPSEWVCGDTTYTTIAQKTDNGIKPYRQHKMVIVAADKGSRRWFELAALNDDLSYPADPNMIGLRAFIYDKLVLAKRHYSHLLKQIPTL